MVLLTHHIMHTWQKDKVVTIIAIEGKCINYLHKRSNKTEHFSWLYILQLDYNFTLMYNLLKRNSSNTCGHLVSKLQWINLLYICAYNLHILDCHW